MWHGDLYWLFAVFSLVIESANETEIILAEIATDKEMDHDWMGGQINNYKITNKQSRGNYVMDLRVDR